MQGKSITRPSDDPAYIFFKIRGCRKSSPERRSWLRRARIALNKLDWLTPSERHEIMCVWSKPSVHLIDSPALRKYLSRSTGRQNFAPQPGQVPACHFMRARFDANGQPTRRKRPKQLAAASLQAVPTNGLTTAYGRIVPPPFAAQIVLPTAQPFSIAGLRMDVRRAVSLRAAFGMRLRN